MAGVGPEIHVTIDGVERVFPLPPMGACHIGRGAQNQIVLNDPEASRSHAVIHRDIGNRCMLSDAGSRNGTLLNGRSVTRSIELADGDTVRVGQHVLVFRCSQSEPAVAGEGDGDATQFISRHRLISVLVADIRGFTQLSRDLGEARLSELMRRFFADTGTMLDRRGAWAQKYIGDAVMAIWTHAGDQVANDELANILAAVAELRRIASAVSEASGLERPLAFGAGINTGYAAVGNMGSGTLADFTALGDTVNLAFRLEAASKIIGNDLVIGRGTLDYLINPLRVTDRPIQHEVALKGYSDLAAVYSMDFDELVRLRYHVRRPADAEPAA